MLELEREGLKRRGSSCSQWSNEKGSVVRCMNLSLPYEGVKLTSRLRCMSPFPDDAPEIFSILLTIRHISKTMTTFSRSDPFNSLSPKYNLNATAPASE